MSFLLLSEWSFTICLTPCNRQYNVLSASLNKAFPSILPIETYFYKTSTKHDTLYDDLSIIVLKTKCTSRHIHTCCRLPNPNHQSRYHQKSAIRCVQVVTRGGKWSRLHAVTLRWRINILYDRQFGSKISII